MRANNIYFDIHVGSRVSSFGKELFIRLTVFSSCDLSICNLSYFPFGFEGRILVLIVSVPDQFNCLCFTIYWLKT